MKNAITLFDTSIATRNVGDEIIMESINKVIDEIASKEQVFRIPTHNYLTLGSYKCLRESKFAVVGGTNLLSSNMPRYQQWNLLPHDSFFIQNIILLGVGWWQYQKSPNFYTRWLLKKSLSKKYMHSVRDGYTLDNLHKIGINNVINTGCATMWDLTPEHCMNIPTGKAEEVVYTLTDYHSNHHHDLEALQILKKNYSKVYLWLQGSKDLKYLKELNADHLVDSIIPPRLKSYDDVLDRENIEYVGTRLHAGIRALQHKKRSLILAVDNRGLEKKKDYNIHVLKREETAELESSINSHRETKLNIDFELISEWKKQFIDFERI